VISTRVCVCELGLVSGILVLNNGAWRLTPAVTFSTTCKIVRTIFARFLSSTPGPSYLIFLAVQQ
jgi:hypothetical protein